MRPARVKLKLWAETAEFQEHHRHELPAFFETIKLLKSDHSATWPRTTGDSFVFLYEIDFISSLHSNQASDFVFNWSLNIFSAVDKHNICITLSRDVPSIYTESVFWLVSARGSPADGTPECSRYCLLAGIYQYETDEQLICHLSMPPLGMISLLKCLALSGTLVKRTACNFCRGSLWIKTMKATEEVW